MKKVIGGAMYSTDTAKYLASWRNSAGVRDFNYCTEKLYRTKSGKYFLHGEGGPMSRYAKAAGNNSWGWGEEIVPLSRKAAMEWAEERLDGDEYEEIFGSVEEGEEPLMLNIAAGLKAGLWAMAENKGVTLSVLVEGLLAEAIKQEVR